MKRCARMLHVFLAVVFCSVISAAPIVSPADHFGFQPGTDGKLISYEELLDYLQKLDDTSDWLRMEDAGASPMGKPMKLLFLSSPEQLSCS